MRAARWVCLLVVAVNVATCDFVPNAACAEQSSVPLEQRFTRDVLPFLKNYCYDCHGAQKQEGKLDLSPDTSFAAVMKNQGTWQIVVERLIAEEMPPQSAPKQPTAETRRAVIEWIRDAEDFEARRNAGQPGLVLARRLSNAEYDNTIRDLTKVDIHPTREFPVDPANEVGFDNSGESLTMSPALVKKYLAAARRVADHLVLTPKGLLFAPHVVVTETDRDKYCVHRIVDFYRDHEVDLADYFYAAWRFDHRSALGKPQATLDDFALEPRRIWPVTGPADAVQVIEQTEQFHDDHDSRHSTTPSKPLSPRYLALVYSALNSRETVGPLLEIQQAWKGLNARFDGRSALPITNGRRVADWELPIYDECQQLRDRTWKIRRSLDTTVERLRVKGIADGTQPFVLWRNRQFATQRMTYHGQSGDADLDAARNRFCAIFPNAFAVTSRGHHSDPNLGKQVRLLTAGFHLMQGYFRDDEPLCQLVLSDVEREELDFLWKLLDFVTLVPYRQYKDYLFAERAEPPHFAKDSEFDFARPENKDVTLPASLNRMRDTYLAKARSISASPVALEAIETYYNKIGADVRWIEQTQIESIPDQLNAVVEFARRAYRRPLTDDERHELLGFYRSLREIDGLGHEDAIRDTVASVLMSPFFCFRYDLAATGGADRPLNDYELANRLSYFLWSSMPDDELLAIAGRNELHQPATLIKQAHRMLRDRRVRGLATEFAGNWLDFRRFEELNSVDRDRFPSFTNELRQAMYEEPLRLFIAVASQNRSVLELLSADYTFVNPSLAEHYGIDIRPHINPSESTEDDDWIRVAQVNSLGRGGLPTMAAFLTRNSPGLRTSPVKRGYWVVRRLLGEHIPAPPPSVPELPKDEAKTGDLTLPQLLAQHRDHKACAGCHQRFDSIGLAFEGFGPIGERRSLDLGGRAVVSSAVYPDHVERTGVAGLQSYLLNDRRDDFTINLCRKLLSYGLGRGLLLSDRPLIDQMQAKLKSDQFHFEHLIDQIVTSRQFLNKSGTN